MLCRDGEGAGREGGFKWVTNGQPMTASWDYTFWIEASQFAQYFLISFFPEVAHFSQNFPIFFRLKAKKGVVPLYLWIVFFFTCDKALKFVRDLDIFPYYFFFLNCFEFTLARVVCSRCGLQQQRGAALPPAVPQPCLWDAPCSFDPLPAAFFLTNIIHRFEWILMRRARSVYSCWHTPF